MAMFCIGFFVVLFILTVIFAVVGFAHELAEKNPERFAELMGCGLLLVLATAGGFAAYFLFGSK